MLVAGLWLVLLPWGAALPVVVAGENSLRSHFHEAESRPIDASLVGVWDLDGTVVLVPDCLVVVDVYVDSSPMTGYCLEYWW